MSFNSGGGGRGGGGGDRFYRAGGGNRSRGGDRGPRRGGGGGYGGGGRRGGRGDRYQPPPRDPKVVFRDRIRALLVRIGEKSANPLPRNIEMLAQALLMDLAEHQDFILTVFFQCVEHLPVKTPIYGTVVGLMNAKNDGFGAAVVAKLNAELSAALEQRQFNRTRMLLRFAAELANAHVVDSAHLLALLDRFCDQLSEASYTTAPLLEAFDRDYIVFLVLHTLLYGGPLLAESHEDEVPLTWNKLVAYMETRPRDSAREALLRPITYSAEHAALNESDCVAELWAACCDVYRSGFVVDRTVLRPYLDFLDRFRDTTTHDLAVVVPHMKLAAPASAALVSTLRLFNPQEDVLHPAERVILGTYIQDTMTHFSTDYKEAVRQIVTMPVLEDGAIDVRMLLVETLFSLLFALPAAQEPIVFYGSVIMKLQSTEELGFASNFPVMLGKAANALFQRLEFVDIECRDRMARWFAFHISNYEFRWPWEAWKTVAQQPEGAAQRAFVREVLDRCVRLAWHQRIVDTLERTPELVKLAGEPREPVAPFTLESPEDLARKAAQDGASDGAATAAEPEAPAAPLDENSQKAKRIVETMRDRSNEAAQVLEVLEELQPGDRLRQLELYVPCALHVGKHSFSHLLTVLGRFQDVLDALNTDAESQRMVLASLRTFWQRSDQHVVTLVDKFIGHGIVDDQVVLDWVFSPEALRESWRTLYAEIIGNIVQRSEMRVAELEKRFARGQGQMQELKERVERIRADFPEVAAAAAAAAAAAGSSAGTPVAVVKDAVDAGVLPKAPAAAPAGADSASSEPSTKEAGSGDAEATAAADEPAVPAPDYPPQYYSMLSKLEQMEEQFPLVRERVAQDVTRRRTLLMSILTRYVTADRDVRTSLPAADLAQSTVHRAIVARLQQFLRSNAKKFQGPALQATAAELFARPDTAEPLRTLWATVLRI